MTTIVTRVGKGSPLTWTEVDSNFTNLNNAKYESGNNASFGTISGTTITASSGFSGALNGTVGATTPASGSFTSLTDSGNLTFTGTGNRITGDFSNGTFANRVAFQSSTSNSQTAVIAIPNGTSTTAQWQAYNNSDPTNASFLGLAAVGSTDIRITSGITGAGSYLPMTFYTGGSERMRIDTSGNVGIGTSSPLELLNVNGTLQLGTPAQNATSVASITNRVVSDPLSVDRAAITLGTTAGASSSSSYISFTTNQYGVSREERMRIDSSGNVGIGTSSPATKLQISANSGYVESRVTSGTNDVGLAIDGSNAYLAVFDAIPLQFQTNSTERMRIDSSGNVGIGTSSPRDVSGYTTLAVNDTTGAIVDYMASGTRIASIGADSGGLDIRAISSMPVIFATNNTERMRIDSSGNVLVGTTTTGITGAGIKFQPGGAQVVIATSANSTNATDTYNMYSTGASAYRFYVDWGGTIHATSTTISAISDQRFKENIQDLDIGLDAVMALKPRKFDWKQGKGKDIKNDRGFIAQEFEQVFPDLIDEWKDPAPEGEEPYKSVRQDLIPVLVKAIQELKAELDTVKAELNTLKGN